MLGMSQAGYISPKNYKNLFFLFWIPLPLSIVGEFARKKGRIIEDIFFWKLVLSSLIFSFVFSFRRHYFYFIKRTSFFDFTTKIGFWNYRTWEKLTTNVSHTLDLPNGSSDAALLLRLAIFPFTKTLRIATNTSVQNLTYIGWKAIQDANLKVLNFPFLLSFAVSTNMY